MDYPTEQEIEQMNRFYHLRQLNREERSLHELRRQRAMRRVIKLCREKRTKSCEQS